MLEENRATQQIEASQPSEGQEEESPRPRERLEAAGPPRGGSRVSEILDPRQQLPRHTQATWKGKGAGFKNK